MVDHANVGYRDPTITSELTGSFGAQRKAVRCSALLGSTFHLQAPHAPATMRISTKMADTFPFGERFCANP